MFFDFIVCCPHFIFNLISLTSSWPKYSNAGKITIKKGQKDKFSHKFCVHVSLFFESFLVIDFHVGVLQDLDFAHSLQQTVPFNEVVTQSVLEHIICFQSLERLLQCAANAKDTFMNKTRNVLRPLRNPRRKNDGYTGTYSPGGLPTKHKEHMQNTNAS